MGEFSAQAQDVRTLIQAQTVVWNGAEPGGAWPVKALPPLITPDHPILGRAKLVEQVVQAFEEGRRSVVLLHLPGVGKTTLAALLAGNRDIQKRFPDGVLWTNVGADSNALVPALRHWASALDVSEQRMRDCGADVTQWREAIGQVLADRRVLLVIDNVWDVGTANVFTLGGPGCGHLFTTRKRNVAVRLTKARFDVGALGAEDGFALLKAFAPEAARVAPAAVKDLVRMVGGLPLALELMGHQLDCAGELGQDERIEIELGHLADVRKRLALRMPGDKPGEPVSLASVMDTSYQMLDADGTDPEALPGDVLRRALQCLSILRPDAYFDRELAQRVTGLDRATTYSALNGLADAGLVEVSILPAPPRAEQAEDEEEEDEERSALQTREAYSIHRTIAEFIRNEKLPPEQRQPLHLAAAAYYADKLKDLENAFQLDPRGYDRWYLYEQRDWQAAKEDWLYHLARADERQQVVVAFLRTWFDGFWWWGVFLDFEFCERLLLEWGQRRLAPEAQRALRMLRQFMDAYPKESEVRSGSGKNWKKVEHLLAEIRSGAGLEADLQTLGEDSRHVRGLTSIFLAEARRFGKQADTATARTFYEDALAAFEANEDEWNTGWVLYHLADMLAAEGRSDEAGLRAREALRLGQTDKDPELQANLHRVLGDAARQEGAPADAARHYHEAVRQAYRFQVDPALPDAYTVQFYSQTAEAVAQRLLAMQKEKRGDALAITQRLHHAWHPADGDGEADTVLSAGEARALARWMFEPSAPEDLLSDADPAARKRYADVVKEHLKAILSP